MGRTEADRLTDGDLAIIRRRDRGCVALGLHRELKEVAADHPPGPCRGKWGDVITGYEIYDRSKTTLEHVHKVYGKAGDREVSTACTLVIACWGHHVEGRGPGAKWVTKKVVRQAVRAMLLRVHPEGCAS